MTHDKLDFQLLFELRVALMGRRLISASLMRVLRARGWVQGDDTYVEVTGSDGSERYPECDCVLAGFRLTRVGQRELCVFRREVSDDEVCAILDGEEGELPDDEAEVE